MVLVWSRYKENWPTLANPLHQPPKRQGKATCECNFAYSLRFASLPVWSQLIKVKKNYWHALIWHQLIIWKYVFALALNHTIPVLFSKPVPAEASSVHWPWPLVVAERARLHFLPANPVSHLQYRKPRMWKKAQKQLLQCPGKKEHHIILISDVTI